METISKPNPPPQTSCCVSNEHDDDELESISTEKTNLAYFDSVDAQLNNLWTDLDPLSKTNNMAQMLHEAKYLLKKYCKKHRFVIVFVGSKRDQRNCCRQLFCLDNNYSRSSNAYGTFYKIKAQILDRYPIYSPGPVDSLLPIDPKFQRMNGCRPYGPIASATGLGLSIRMAKLEATKNLYIELQQILIHHDRNCPNCVFNRKYIEEIFDLTWCFRKMTAPWIQKKLEKDLRKKQQEKEFWQELSESDSTEIDDRDTVSNADNPSPPTQAPILPAPSSTSSIVDKNFETTTTVTLENNNCHQYGIMMEEIVESKQNCPPNRTAPYTGYRRTKLKPTLFDRYLIAANPFGPIANILHHLLRFLHLE